MVELTELRHQGLQRLVKGTLDSPASRARGPQNDKNPAARPPRLYLIASYVRQVLMDDVEGEMGQLRVQSPNASIAQLRDSLAMAEYLMGPSWRTCAPRACPRGEGVGRCAGQQQLTRISPRRLPL